MDEFTRDWIIEHSISIVDEYETLTIRALYYRLVADHGMINSINHYKRVVAAMGKARWDGIIPFNTFIDHERSVIGNTPSDPTDVDSQVKKGKAQVVAWMNAYSKNKWENQDNHIEVWVEKKALQSVFSNPCSDLEVALFPCKGYPSLTLLHEAAERFKYITDELQKNVIILYFGDYDPSGEDIPRSIEETLYDMGCYIDVQRILLLESDVYHYDLPPAPTKKTDSRSSKWGGIGQVELDALDPKELDRVIRKEVDRHFDNDLYHELLIQEEFERAEYKRLLKEYVENEIK